MEKFVITLAILCAKGQETQAVNTWEITLETPIKDIKDMISSAAQAGYFLDVEEIPCDFTIGYRIIDLMSAVATEMGFRPVTGMWSECWYENNLVVVDEKLGLIGDVSDVQSEIDRLTDLIKEMENEYHTYESWKKIHREGEEEE